MAHDPYGIRKHERLKGKNKGVLSNPKALASPILDIEFCR